MAKEMEISVKLQIMWHKKTFALYLVVE